MALSLVLGYHAHVHSCHLFHHVVLVWSNDQRKKGSSGSCLCCWGLCLTPPCAIVPRSLIFWPVKRFLNTKAPSLSFPLCFSPSDSKAQLKIWIFTQRHKLARSSRPHCERIGLGDSTNGLFAYLPFDSRGSTFFLNLTSATDAHELERASVTGGGELLLQNTEYYELRTNQVRSLPRDSSSHNSFVLQRARTKLGGNNADNSRPGWMPTML